jgi:exopolysaccharide biosynthesis polyprenyl glycosylphosphotransferase
MSETISPSSTLGAVEGLRLGARARAGGGLQRDRFWRLARPIMDAALLGVATLFATFASPLDDASLGGVHWPLAFAGFVIGLSLLHGAYARHLRIDVLDDLRGTLVDVAVAMMATITLRVLLDGAPPEAAEQTLRIGVFAAVYVAAGRVFLDLAQAQARRTGETVVPTLIIGAGKIGRTTAKRLLEHPELGLLPIGFLDKEPRFDVKNGAPLPVLGASWDFDRVVADKRVGQVIITFSTAPNEVLLRIVKRCEELGVGVSLVPRLFEKVTDRLTIEHLGGLPLLTAHPSNPKGWQFAVKYTLDRIVAFVILVAVAPVFAAVAVAVWISLGRPVLFRQLRVGRDGRPFEMLKFRSMQPHRESSATAELATLQAPADDLDAERRSRLGKLLRQTSLDELPQLINVLRGDMSLIGPRPERPELVELFESRIYRYDERHRVKSGITGWAQVHGIGRGHERFGDVSLSERAEWDNYYIENWSLWLDVKILLETILTVFRFRQR